MTTSIENSSTDHVITEIAKLLTQAMHEKYESGEYLMAERLSVCRDLLAAPNLREPMVPTVAKGIHQE